MNAADVKGALRRRHGQRSGEWVCIEEAFCGFSTYSGGIDLWALGVWRTAKVGGLLDVAQARHPSVAYEVKVSRSDFRRELYGTNPTNRWSRGAAAFDRKQAFALAVSDYLMFATPAGLLKPDEVAARAGEDGALYLPEGAGLVEVGEDGVCRVKVKATRRPEPKALTRHQIAELIRHAIDPNALREARLTIASQQERIRQLALNLRNVCQELDDLRPRERVA